MKNIISGAIGVVDCVDATDSDLGSLAWTAVTDTMLSRLNATTQIATKPCLNNFDVIGLSVREGATIAT
jgi:hypothetical protein